MTTVYEVPLRPSTPQTLNVVLGSMHVSLRLIWLLVGPFPGDDPSFEEGGWIMDISDNIGNPLACGIPLVTGVNLVGQFPDLGLPPMWVATDGDPDAVPTFANLGVLSHLYFML